MEKAKVTELLRNDGSDADGGAIETPPWRESGRGMVVATYTGTGAGVGGTVTISGSHDGTRWVQIGALALTGAGGDTKAQAIDYPWPFLRAVSSAGAGTRTGLRVTLAQ